MFLSSMLQAFMLPLGNLWKEGHHAVLRGLVRRATLLFVQSLIQLIQHLHGVRSFHELSCGCSILRMYRSSRSDFAACTTVALPFPLTSTILGVFGGLWSRWSDLMGELSPAGVDI
ncbi:hypothetical protein Tco_1055383 [Tanacetum coccineum]|uniref:Uncharacterized protein n=1 Tax=Tanacetum coccineum TaxID=301880 RepID=A0ABQ5H0P0_9ASTR